MKLKERQKDLLVHQQQKGETNGKEKFGRLNCGL